MKKPLPIKLQQEPIVEAVFEIRFHSEIAASSILLGVLFNKIKDEVNDSPQVIKLPIAEIPQQVRDIDLALKYAPQFRMNYGDYALLIGDRVFGIAINLPYQGWSDFKKMILKLVCWLKNSGVSISAERYSLKYVDLLEAETTRDQLKLIKQTVKVGQIEIKSEALNLRVEIPEPHKNIVHIIQIVSDAILQKNDEQKKGLLIATDSITNNLEIDFWDRDTLDQQLEIIHDANKTLFFDCLQESTLVQLGATYD